MRKADRLVVLERGKIVEVGTHDELLAQPGRYAQLYEAQMRAGDLPGSPAPEGDAATSAAAGQAENQEFEGGTIGEPR